MPRVVQITYGRTFNNGKDSFESSRIDLVAELGLNESYDDAFKELFDNVSELRDIELDRVYKPKRKSTNEDDFESQPRRRRA